MNLLADENIEKEIVLHLRKKGFTVIHIQESHPGLSDEKVLDLAFEKHYFLLTEDKDFGELVYREKKRSRGVLLLRLEGLSADEKAGIVERTLKKYQSDLIGGFSVVTSKDVRVRKWG